MTTSTTPTRRPRRRPCRVVGPERQASRGSMSTSDHQADLYRYLAHPELESRILIRALAEHFRWPKR